MNGITPSIIDPTQAIKTHVSEMSPAQKLAAHDLRAREANADLPTVTPGEETFETVTVENLCAIALDVVKNFARQGFDTSTITNELVVEKVVQRFPNGIRLALPVTDEPETVIVISTPPLVPVKPEGGELAPDSEKKPKRSAATKTATKNAPKKTAPRRAPKGPPPSKS